MGASISSPCPPVLAFSFMHTHSLFSCCTHKASYIHSISLPSSCISYSPSSDIWDMTFLRDNTEEMHVSYGNLATCMIFSQRLGYWEWVERWWQWWWCREAKLGKGKNEEKCWSDDRKWGWKEGKTADYSEDCNEAQATLSRGQYWHIYVKLPQTGH